MDRLNLDFFNNPFSTDTRTPSKNIHPLDYVDEYETVYTCRELHLFSSASPSTDIGTISDITLNSASSFAYTLVTSTIGSQYTDEKEEAREGGIYNRITSDYCNLMLRNVNRCPKRTLWFCNSCSRFNKKTYYYQQVGRDCFVTHHDSLICHP